MKEHLYDDPPIRMMPAGRTCTNCSKLLSQYNKGKRCLSPCKPALTLPHETRDEKPERELIAPQVVLTAVLAHYNNLPRAEVFCSHKGLGRNYPGTHAKRVLIYL